MFDIYRICISFETGILAGRALRSSSALRPLRGQQIHVTPMKHTDLKKKKAKRHEELSQVKMFNLKFG